MIKPLSKNEKKKNIHALGLKKAFEYFTQSSHGRMGPVDLGRVESRPVVEAF